MAHGVFAQEKHIAGGALTFRGVDFFEATSNHWMACLGLSGGCLHHDQAAALQELGARVF